MDKERIKMKSISDRNAAGFLLIFTDESSRAAYERFRKAFYGEPKYYLFKSPEEALDSERNIVIFASDLANLFGINTDKFLSALDEMKSVKDMTGLFSTTVRMKTAYETYSTLEAKNVLGYIEGTDKKDEWIILTAHYDHLGMEDGRVFNGAYDNAAGVASVIETAGAFAAAAEEGFRPRRSVVFYLPDAEELGGVGSMHFLDNPPFPLAKISAAINIDGIGREDADNPRLKDFVHFYISRLGGEELGDIRDLSASVSRGLRLHDRDGYGGSDHAFFERKGIPVIALSTGHPGDHHKPTDTADKLDYKNIQDIARLAFACAWRIANSEERIKRISSIF